MSDIRLINANALKEQIDDCNYFHSSFQKMTVAEFLTIVFDYIDNAPTVYPICSYDCKYATVYKRTKGEWKHHEEYTNNRTFYITECPFCKLRVQEETNFCPNCGADMRGDKE